jgi:PIN domain nuclease of toxin-antitoxin system
VNTLPNSGGVLLDTCALIWLGNRDPMAEPALDAIGGASRRGVVLISPVSAWEIGLLAAPRAGRTSKISFIPDAKTWFSSWMVRPGIAAAPLTPEIAIDASFLPGSLHADPADRLLIATARHLGVPIVTRDGKVIAYADEGHVRVIPC